MFYGLMTIGYRVFLIKKHWGYNGISWGVTHVAGNKKKDLRLYIGDHASKGWTRKI